VLGAGLSLRTSEAYEGRAIVHAWNFDGLDDLEVSYRDGGCAFIGTVRSASVYMPDGTLKRLVAIFPKPLVVQAPAEIGEHEEEWMHHRL